MTIQYCSDLHIEFHDNDVYLKNHPLKPVGDILVLAGDIIPFAKLSEADWFFDLIASQFKAVYWVPGNHEYFGSDITERSGTFLEEIRENVFLTNNTVVRHGDVRLILSTMWTEIGEENQHDVRMNMPDFHFIEYKKGRFGIIHYNDLHMKAKEFISNALTERHDGKTVVVTHHVPTLLNYPERFRGSMLNECFAVELRDLIQLSGVDYWIYGHHHQNVPEFTVGKTKLVQNQLGYVRKRENLSFDTACVLKF